jgi:hypothetical protein
MPRTNQIPYLSPSRRTPGATYHWKPSPKLRRFGFGNLRLGDDWDAACVGAVTRNNEVDRWLADNADKAPAARSAPKIMRWRDLVAAYRQSDGKRGKRCGYRALKPKSRAEYDSRIDFLNRWALDGDLRLSDLDRHMIIDLRDNLIQNCSAYKAAAVLRVLSLLCAFAADRGWLPLGLAAKLGIPEPPKRSHRILIGQLPLLLEAAEKLDLPHMRLGVVLGFFTMQREGDLLATTSFRFRPITGDDISGDARRALAGPDGRVLGLFLTQEKVNKPVGVPLIPRARVDLEAAIAASRDAGSTLTNLIVKNGRPCHEKTFQRDYARLRCKAAEIAREALQEHLAAAARANDAFAWAERRETLEALQLALEGSQFRDLRRSGMCWLRELGVPVAMIASISGHSIDETQKILDTYMPRDTRSAAEGMAIAVTRQAARDAADLVEQEQITGP